MVNSLKFSLFYDTTKGMYTTEPRREINFDRLIEIYKHDTTKGITEKIRLEQDKAKQQELKKQLPFITPFGTFAPTRANVNITHFNSRLIPLDIDDLEPHEIELIKFNLTSNYSTLLCNISPRGKGIKALILINDYIPLEDCYNTLKLNRYHIAECLGISEFWTKIDFQQFKLPQPWFIAYDENIFINKNCKALDVKLIPYHKPVIIDEPIDFYTINNVLDTTKYLEPINYRIKIYFQNAVNGLIKLFACCSEGNRHSSIIKVQSIASWIHYAPQIESEVKESLLNACCKMYGSHKEAEANNVYKSFEDAWKKAPIKQNKTIEGIINDTKYKTSIPHHSSIKQLLNK